MVYDITDRSTFEQLDKIYEEYKEPEGIQQAVIVIGNKMDLEDARQVSEVEGKEYADSKGFQFIETSALLEQGG